MATIPFAFSDKDYFIPARFKMAELTKFVVNRKATRSRVTRSFNERESFRDFTPVQCEVEKSNLLDYQ